jgi:hypothetical protein
MQMRQAKIIAAVVVMLVAAGLLASRWYFPMPKIEPRPHAGLGEALAERAVQLAGGGRVVLLTPDTSGGKFPGTAIQLRAFHAALRRANQAVVLTNVIKIDPNRVLRAPPGDFADLLRKFTEADVVVSLLGPPVLNGDQKARVGDKRPKVIAACLGDMPRQVNLKAIFNEQFLQAAIISRASPALTTPGSENPADWFQHYFQWVTPQNLADLPATAVK